MNIRKLVESKLFNESDFHRDKRFQQNWPFISDNAIGIVASNKRKHSSETLYCIYDPDSNYTYMEFYLDSYEDSVNKFFKKSGDARKECLKYVDEVKSGHGWTVYYNIRKDETWENE